MEQGFQAVSVDQIVAAVPVSKPTLYTHFEDKRDLFAAVINQRCSGVVAAIEAGIAQNAAPEAGLTAFGHHLLDLLLSPQSIQFHRVMVGESTSFPEMAELFYESGPRKMHKLLEDYLRKKHKEGALNVPDPALAASMFLGMLKGPAHLKCVLGIVEKEVGAAERKKIVKTAVDIFLNGHKI